MPGWHAKTKDLVARGELTVLGIVEEQHPDRAKLFMQWQQMGWKVLSDPLNLLGVDAIPHTFLIDEHGIIRFKNPRSADFESFLATDYQKPAKIDRPDISPAVDSAEHSLLWGGEAALDEAVGQLEKRTAARPADAIPFFRLGVAYRMRFDSTERQPGDFPKAVAAWRKALELNPSQYIWRRRIQQYGPRLDKPYSFYDWVNEAREVIIARGEIPHRLAAEPGGSEFASSREAKNSSGTASHPDPGGKIPRDTLELVQVEQTVVPSTDKSKPAFRVHLRFRPSGSKKVHWTNDAGALAFFAEMNPLVKIIDQQPPPARPEELTTDEERSVEFEVRPAGDSAQLPPSLTGAAFYYVCEDVNGVCQYLRQDIEIQLR
ncbi:MAG: hypothetical protein ACI8XO_000802 [Verrucomicrobiales bacterium]